MVTVSVICKLETEVEQKHTDFVMFIFAKALLTDMIFTVIRVRKNFW